MCSRTIRLAGLLVVLVVFSTINVGCATAPGTREERTTLEKEAADVVVKAMKHDPTLGRLLNDAAGYAVFPSVGKGAIGFGGAYGKGVLFEKGEPAGFCDLTQVSIGFQFGGQAYTEIIAFETAADLENFRQGHFTFAAQATAVALTAGAGANSNYREGAAVFTLNEAGLMYEAAIGGQKFSFEAKEKVAVAGP